MQRADADNREEETSGGRKCARWMIKRSIVQREGDTVNSVSQRVLRD